MRLKNPINQLEYFEEKQILVSADVTGKICLLNMANEVEILHTLITVNNIIW